MTENSELVLRVRDLEQFKHKLEIKLFAAWCIASVLGIVGVLGGAWLNNVSQKLVKLEKRTVTLEASLENWEKQVSYATEALSADKDRYQAELIEQSQVSLAKVQEAIDSTSKERLKELLKIGSSDLISALQNGAVSLNLRKLSISNANGVETVAIGSDSGGDGILNINSELGANRYSTKLIKDNAITTYKNSDGKVVLHVGSASDVGLGLMKMVNPLNGSSVVQLDGVNNSGNIRVYSSAGQTRFQLKLENDRPIARFYNTSSQAVVGLGAFKNDDKGFLRIYDPREDKTVAELSGGKEGGRSFYYTQGGKQLIYIGPAANTGDALIKLSTRYGESEKDLSPKN